EGTKVSEFIVGKDELVTDLRDRIKGIVGLDSVIYKGSEPLKYALVTGPVNKVQEGDTITVRTYKARETEESLYGHKVSIMAIAGANSFSEYIRYREPIEALKQRIAATLRTNPEQIELWKRTIQLEDGKTAEEYQIGSGCRVTVKAKEAQMEEVIAESSNAHKTQQAEPQHLIDMDWEEMEQTIMVDVGAGSIRTTYHVPYEATPQHVIYRYAKDVQNDLYLNGYALYTSSQMLP